MVLGGVVHNGESMPQVRKIVHRRQGYCAKT
jgi:hypothetical protein